MRRWLAELGAGFVLGLRGLVAKEVRTRSRGWRGMWLLTVYLGLLAAAVCGLLALVVQASGTVPPQLGVALFYALAIGAVLLLAFITPALTAGAISGERERRTLELLLVTRASALGLAAGKLAGSLLYVVFLLVASLPAFTLVYLFGGVRLRYVAMVVAVALVTALAHAALGLLLSATIKRTGVATALAYVLVVVAVIGVPIGATAAATVRWTQDRGVGPPPLLAYVSPLPSLLSVLPGGNAGDSVPRVGLPALGIGARVPLAAPGPGPLPFTQSVYAVGAEQDPSRAELVVTWAPWVYHFVLSGAFVAGALVLAALAITPLKPWRRR